jgi:hypothetical protein
LTCQYYWKLSAQLIIIKKKHASKLDGKDMAREVSVDLVQGAQMMSAQTENICDLIIEEVVTEYVRYVSLR